MEIYCQTCQKRVGQVADEKIPVGRPARVKCPQCGEQISLIRPTPEAAPEEGAAIGAGADDPALAPPAEPARAIPGWGETACEISQPMASGMTPDYDFTIGAILSEAWQKTSGVKGPLWGAGFMAFFAIAVLAIVMALVVRMLDLETAGVTLGAAMQVTITVAMYPFMAGLMMIAIRRSVELPTNWKMAFAYFSYLLPVVAASLMTTVLSFIGFLFLMFPGIYLIVGYMLTIPLIVDRGMGPWQAMEASRQAIHKHWFKVFGLYFVMVLIYLVSLIPLGLGLIWSLPMFFMVSAILYREIFGVSEKT